MWSAADLGTFRSIEKPSTSSVKPMLGRPTLDGLLEFVLAVAQPVYRLGGWSVVRVAF